MERGLCSICLGGTTGNVRNEGGKFLTFRDSGGGGESCVTTEAPVKDEGSVPKKEEDDWGSGGKGRMGSDSYPGRSS